MATDGLGILSTRRRRSQALTGEKKLAGLSEGANEDLSRVFAACAMNQARTGSGKAAWADHSGMRKLRHATFSGGPREVAADNEGCSKGLVVGIGVNVSCRSRSPQQGQLVVSMPRISRSHCSAVCIAGNG